MKDCNGEGCSSCQQSKHSINKHLESCSGEELIALAGVISVQISKCMNIEELGCFTEFLGLLKHDLEIIKFRRFINKVESQKQS